MTPEQRHFTAETARRVAAHAHHLRTRKADAFTKWHDARIAGQHEKAVARAADRLIAENERIERERIEHNIAIFRGRG